MRFFSEQIDKSMNIDINLALAGKLELSAIIGRSVDLFKLKLIYFSLK